MTTDAASPLPVRNILKNRYFLLLWMAQAVTQVAQNAVGFVVMVIVQDHTHSTTQTSCAVLSFITPSVLFGILAGVLVDRADKRMVLVATNLLRAGAVLGYFFTDGAFALFFLVTFIFSTISQFFGPAEIAAIPMLVRRDQLITANSLFQLTVSVSQLLGFVLLAPLVIKFFGTQAFGVRVFFSIIAAIYVLAALMVWFLPPDREKPKPLTGEEGSTLVRGVLEEIGQGWRIITGDRATWTSVLQLTLMSTLLMALAPLATAFAESVIRVRPEDAAYILAPAGLGVLVGTLAMPGLARRFAKGTLINLGLVSMGLGLMALAAVKTGGSYLLYNVVGRIMDTAGLHQAVGLVPIVMVLAFLLGLEFASVNIPAQTVLQERCPPSFRGRIFAVWFVLSNVASILPLIFIGAVADLIGVNKVILLIGVGIMLFGLASVRHDVEERIRAVG